MRPFLNVFATLCGTMSCLTSANAAEPEPQELEYEQMDDDPATLEWIALGDRLALEVVSEPGTSFSVQYEARLGALSYAWETGPFYADEAGTFLVVPVPPAEAWLDPLALDYVTVLKASVIINRADGRWTGRILAPPAFLVWPDGLQGVPVLWNLDRVRRDAPGGVLSAELRAHLGPDIADWVLPPLPYVVPPESEHLTHED